MSNVEVAGTVFARWKHVSHWQRERVGKHVAGIPTSLQATKPWPMAHAPAQFGKGPYDIMVDQIKNHSEAREKRAEHQFLLQESELKDANKCGTVHSRDVEK